MTAHARGAKDPIEFVVRGRVCRRCHAPATEPCRNHPSDRRMHISHAARYADAREAGDLDFITFVPTTQPHGFVL